MPEQTLVLGGGGLFGVAWMIGLILGLEEGGFNLRQPRAVIGTSAGSVAGAQLLSGELSTQELFERQAIPDKQARQRSPEAEQEAAAFALLSQSWSDADARLQALCALALNNETISWQQRRVDIVERLGRESSEWPRTPLAMTAVDLDSRELKVFDASSGVDLVDAVAASCAVPGVWPITPIGGRRYIDGGVWRTAENAHLAAGAPSVLILSPFGRVQAARSGEGPSLGADVAALRAAGSRVSMIAADSASLSVLRGIGALNPKVRQPSAEAGRIQGRKEAEALIAASR